MNWKTKALIQRAIAGLPACVGEPLYYLIQRSAGGLQTINPRSRLEAAVRTWDHIIAHGSEPREGTFFELGTGRMLTVPFAYSLMGAGRVLTVDQTRYLAPRLVAQTLSWFNTHQDAVLKILGHRVDRERLARLLYAVRRGYSLMSILDTYSIEYRAPFDAADARACDREIDFYTSFTVLEHIPPKTLVAILSVGRQWLRVNGLMVHCIDYSDHFSHTDSSISPLHFLRYTAEEWASIAGNRFMYQSRLRHSDYVALCEDAGLRVLSSFPDVNEGMVAMLHRGELPVAEPFIRYKTEDVATLSAWIIAGA